MTAVNYEDEWWARVYDSIYYATRQQEHDFYVQQARSLAEPVLELACGTGTVLLDLLRLGVDAYGFDISQPMLDMLQRKMPVEQRDQTLRRISRQNMVDFEYPSLQFGTVLIPSGSFLFLLTEDERIACLKNVHHHLRSGGRLVLNFAVPSHEHLASLTKEPRPFADLGDFTDAISGSKVHVSCRSSIELATQLWHMDWCFAFGSELHKATMCFRWILPEEFTFLLRLAGFASCDVRAGFDGEQLTAAGGEAVWTAVK